MGSREPEVKVVQPPPPQVTPSPVQAPTAGETAADIAQAKLQYDPQLAAQQYQLYQQYAPQTAQIQQQIQQNLAPGQAQSEFDIRALIAPQERALFEQLFPTQAQGLETLAQQSLQRLESPQSLTPEQLAAQEQLRGRTTERFQRGIRSSANLGGNLFSGARQRQEREGLAELETAFLNQDIQRQAQQRAQALQEFITAQQVASPQIQQPGVAQGFTPQYQSAAPSPDALMQAILGARSQFITTPSVVGFGDSPFSQNAALLGSAFQGAGAALGPSIAACHVAEELYGKDDIRTHLARLYANTHNSPFLRLYRGFSDVMAAIVRRVPWLKPKIKPVWDRMWQQQLKEMTNGS